MPGQQFLPEPISYKPAVKPARHNGTARISLESTHTSKDVTPSNDRYRRTNLFTQLHDTPHHLRLFGQLQTHLHRIGAVRGRKIIPRRQTKFGHLLGAAKLTKSITDSFRGLTA